MKAKLTFTFSDGGSFTVVENVEEYGGELYPEPWEGVANHDEMMDSKLGHPAYGYIESAYQRDFHPWQTWLVYNPDGDLVSGTYELVRDD